MTADREAVIPRTVGWAMGACLDGLFIAGVGYPDWLETERPEEVADPEILPGSSR